MDSTLVKFVILKIRNLVEPTISDDQVWGTADSKDYPATINQFDRFRNGQRERYSGHVRGG